MISKDMYCLLTHIPRAGESINFEELNALHFLNISLLKKLLEEADEFNYIRRERTGYRGVLTANLQLSEVGQVAVEEYEHEEQRRKESAESVSIARNSLSTSKWALLVAIFGTIAGILPHCWDKIVLFFNNLF